MNDEIEASTEEDVTASDAPDKGGEEPAGDPASQLAAAEAKAAENWEQVLRARAELENLRRRSERELENAHKYALEKFARELLPVRDSLELGLQAAIESGQTDADKLREGVELTLKMLSDVMERFGISEINPQDEPFDPEQHQAMSMLESPDKAPNTVLSVMQKGYTLNDRLIRPAMVVVSKATEGADETKVDEKA
ncbi:MAG TPA: nucleotide exchange factor GrpE [Gammaproteobacteria bacterium]|nr:nucleotide exchange factor GrpE [Gammaproteobacteria bacterium]